jgi:EXS family
MAGFTIGVLITFFILMFNPFRYLFKTELLLMKTTVYNIVISPFGLVRFKHFFLAAIFISMSQVLKDLGYIGCFLLSGAWRLSEEPSMDKCPHLENYLLLIVFIPYWFRFAQCFKRYKDDPKKDKIALINAGKVFTSLLVLSANIFKQKFK